MNKRLLLVLFPVLFLSANLKALAQVKPVKIWDKRFGGTETDGFSSVHQTADGGYFFSGSSSSGQNGDKGQPSKGGADAWILKTDASGNKLWDKSFGGTSDEHGGVSIPVASGGYLLGITSNSGVGIDKTTAAKGGSDFWLVRIDANGNKLWDKTIGGTSNDWIGRIQPTADGGYILGGKSSSGIGADKSQGPRGNGDIWIVKIDSSGNKLWDKTFGTLAEDDFIDVWQTPDGGYVVAAAPGDIGISGDKTASKGRDDYWLLKLDATGNKLWDKAYGGNAQDHLESFVACSDGGFLLGGTSYTNINGDKTDGYRGAAVTGDFWIIRVDANGNKLWDKTFGGDWFEYFLNDMIQTPDGGFLIGGESASGITGEKTEARRGDDDIWIMRLNANGNLLWDKTLGGTLREQVGALLQTADGGYLVLGSSLSGANGDKTQASRGKADAWVIKLGPGCTDLQANIVASCTNQGVTANAAITGIQPSGLNPGTWTMIYSINGVNQTVTGSASSVLLQQNATPGTTFSLVSITSGSCNITLNKSLVVPQPIGQPVISLISPDTLVSSITGTSYEWYLNGTKLPANSRKLRATATGIYSVKVKNLVNCISALSPDYNFTVSGLMELAENLLQIYPNPTNGKNALVIAIQQEGEITILNATGQTMYKKTVSKTDKKVPLQFDLAAFATGIYLIQFSTEKQLVVKKLVVN